MASEEISAHTNPLAMNSFLVIIIISCVVMYSSETEAKPRNRLLGQRKTKGNEMKIEREAGVKDVLKLLKEMELELMGKVRQIQMKREMICTIKFSDICIS